MNNRIRIFEFKHLIVMTAHGKLDLVASKAALKSLVAAPGFDAIYEVLLDLRDVECDMSADDIHELVTHMAWHIPVLFDDHRIAVLVKKHAPGDLVFNHAQFLDLCAQNNGFNIRAHEDYDHAIQWLNTDLSNASIGTVSAQGSAPPMPGRRSQSGLV
jgi:hypothetical protein